MADSVLPEAGSRSISDAAVVPVGVGSPHAEASLYFHPHEEEESPLSFAPNRLSRPSDAPLSSPRSSEFEVVSARFRSLDAARSYRHQRSIHDDARKIIQETSKELRARSLASENAVEKARFAAFAESVNKLLESTTALEYLRHEDVSREIVAYLERYKNVRRAVGDVDDLRDVILKASVTAIHVAPCLGYWRSNPNVPIEIRRLLTAENVFGSVFRIAKERKARWFDRLLARYTTLTGELKGAPGKDGPIPIKTRNAILWPWCKFNIRNVTYKLHHGHAGVMDAEEAVADVKLALVLFNVLLDDIADSVQDAELLCPFLAIPFASGTFGVASPEAYASLRDCLGAVGWPQFEAYFDLAVDCWVASIERLQAAVGPSYDALEADFSRDYELLLKAMQFSVDLNNRPREVFGLSPAVLEQRYGSSTFGDILAHNANRAVFFTIDMMCFRAFDPSRYEAFVRAGALDVYRENAWLCQDLQQIGNSVSTGARETESDDISNELFKIANDRLNTIDDWPIPEPLAAVPGFTRRDAVFHAFELKKAAKKARNALPAGSPEQDVVREEYKALGEAIEQLVEMSGAEHYYFHHWLERREKAVDVFYRAADWLDQHALVAANDLVLVLHLMYKGRI